MYRIQILPINLYFVHMWTTCFHLGERIFFFSRKTSFISFDFHLKKKNRFCLKLFDFYPFESLPDRWRIGKLIEWVFRREERRLYFVKFIERIIFCLLLATKKINIFHCFFIVLSFRHYHSLLVSFTNIRNFVKALF